MRSGIRRSRVDVEVWRAFPGGAGAMGVGEGAATEGWWIMSTMVETWERIEPDEACASPDGHSPIDIYSAGQSVPILVRCDRCGKNYRVAVHPN